VDNKKIVKEGYNAITAEYLAARKEDSEDVQLLQELVQHLPEDAEVLDVGCGAGVPVTLILSQSFEVTGVDFSEAQIRLARQLVPQAQFVCQDITELAFPDNSFDAICSYYAIIHIPRQEHKRLLRNFYRMLRPSGLVLLCMGAGDLEDDFQEDYFGTRMYWSHYGADTNIKMLQECGFNVVWSKFVVESPAFGGGKHLFVLAQNS